MYKLKRRNSSVLETADAALLQVTISAGSLNVRNAD